MEKVAVLIVVKGGVAYEYSPEFADVRIVDLDNIEAGDGPEQLPDTPAWRALAEHADLADSGECAVIEFVKEKETR